MGIYIIKSIHSDWIKVGHHKITEKRPSVYYRYINRGFYSCKCPQEIKGKVGFNDLELLYWFENLDIENEINLHKQLNLLYEFEGEWYKFNKIQEIVNIILNEYNGINKMPSEVDLQNALLWCKKPICNKNRIR